MTVAQIIFNRIPVVFCILASQRRIRTALKIMWPSIRKLLLQPGFLLAVYILVALIASIQAILLPPHYFAGNAYTEYNNYVIFKNSFSHLLSGQNLYVLYPARQWDLYKYSPTFALFMGLLAYLPDYIGLSIWNLLNAITLFLAVRLLPFPIKKQALLLWFVLIELLTSLQNAQSNGLMAGLMIAAFGCLEQRKPLWAALWLVLATYIKVYGAVGFCLFFFYPGKMKFIGYSLFWTTIMAVLPLAVTPLHILTWQYHNWASMMAGDQSSSYGLSVMGWLHTWFGVNSGKTLVSLLGIVLFFIPFVRIKLYQNEIYKLLMLASTLIWVIIFNHKAESPTFIIAVAGVGIWYFSQPRRAWRDALLAIVFIFTCLSPTDLFPPYIRQQFFGPYVIKVIPCIIMWAVVFIELMRLKPSTLSKAPLHYTSKAP
jgi:hypothetical protein